MLRRLLAALALAFSAAVGSGCAVTPKTAPAPREVTIFRGDTGTAAPWEAVVSAACHCDALLIGETHGNPVGLPAAAALWEDVLARTTNATLCLEFFERDTQSRMDDYLAGIIDEAAFRQKTGRTPSGYPEGHRAMVEAAKAAKRPVIASNAPQTYVRLARTEGYERLQGLTAEQRRLFRIPDELPTGPYRENFDKVITSMSASGHGGPPEPDEAKRKKRLDDGFRAQSLWDWTMADAVATRLNAGDRPVVQVVGRFHVENQGGLLLALQKLRPGTSAVTVTFVDEDATALREEDRGRADFVVYVGPSEGD